MRAISAVVGLAFVTLTCIPAAAQYNPGDVVFPDFINQRLLGITSQGRVYTVTSALGVAGWTATPGPLNRSVWVSGNLPFATVQVDQKGTVVRLSTLCFYAMDVDSSGNVVGGAGSQIVKVNSGKVTSLWSGPPFSGICGGGIELQTGDLILADPSHIHRVVLHGNVKVSTILSIGSGVGHNLHSEPETGTMIGSWWNGLFRLRLGPSPGMSTLYVGTPFSSVVGLDRDPSDGSYVIANGCRDFNTASAVFRLDARSKAIATLASFSCKFPYPPGTVFPTAVTLAGSRHLCGINDARIGTAYRLQVSSPNESGAVYAVAISFGFRPGIPVGKSGRTVYLNPDPLFHYSLSNSGICSGFQGRLNSAGEASASIAIPNIPSLSRLRFFACAVTIVNNQISVISDPLGVTIQ